MNDSAFGYGPVPGARSGIFVLYVIWSWRLRQVGCDGFQHGNMGEGKQPFSSGQNKILGDDGLKPTTTSKFGQIIQNVNILTAKAWEDLRANINGGDSISSIVHLAQLKSWGAWDHGTKRMHQKEPFEFRADRPRPNEVYFPKLVGCRLRHPHRRQQVHQQNPQHQPPLRSILEPFGGTIHGSPRVPSSEQWCNHTERQMSALLVAMQKLATHSVTKGCECPA